MYNSYKLQDNESKIGTTQIIFFIKYTGYSTWLLARFWCIDYIDFFVQVEHAWSLWKVKSYSHIMNTVTV